MFCALCGHNHSDPIRIVTHRQQLRDGRIVSYVCEESYCASCDEYFETEEQFNKNVQSLKDAINKFSKKE